MLVVDPVRTLIFTEATRMLRMNQFDGARPIPGEVDRTRCVILC